MKQKSDHIEIHLPPQVIDDLREVVLGGRAVLSKMTLEVLANELTVDLVDSEVDVTLVAMSSDRVDELQAFVANGVPHSAFALGLTDEPIQ